MRKLLEKIYTGLMMVAAILLAAMIFTTVQDAEAQASRNNPVPQRWVDSSGANGFALNSAAVPVVMLTGTNYTGVSTNVSFLIGTGVTNRLRIINGVITGVIAGP